jgi:hypothetical protein
MATQSCGAVVKERHLELEIHVYVMTDDSSDSLPLRSYNVFTLISLCVFMIIGFYKKEITILT